MSFENAEFREEVLDLQNPYDVEYVKDFLKELDFDYQESEVDYTMTIYSLNDEIVGTGSCDKHILKYVAVAPKYRETAAFSQIVTHLLDRLLLKHPHIFVYTLPRNVVLFKGLGFKEIASAPPLFSVLEFGYENIKKYQDYLTSLKVKNNPKIISSIVVNCNPFTNGHLYLIEKAAKESDVLYLFVVEEDKSSFPFKTRWDLVKRGISHLSNVVMISGGNYVVSGNIFPSYFIKNAEVNEISQKQAELDIKTFIKYIVPTLEINRRYVGTEDYCKTTLAYNNAMKQFLPDAGVKLCEIKRKSVNTLMEQESIISASKVRKAIKNDTLNKIIEFLPKVTQDFLQSNDSLLIRQNIKQGKGRH